MSNTQLLCMSLKSWHMVAVSSCPGNCFHIVETWYIRKNALLCASMPEQNAFAAGVRSLHARDAPISCMEYGWWYTISHQHWNACQHILHNVIGRKRVAGLFSLFVLFVCCYMQSGTVKPVVTHQRLGTTGECVVQQNLAGWKLGSMMSCCWHFQPRSLANKRKHILKKISGVADAWKSFTDSVSEVFEPAKTPEGTKPAQDTPSSKAGCMPLVMYDWLFYLSLAQCCKRQLQYG